jgi:hypothetical protein
MAYDQELSDRVRPLLARKRGFYEKRMFGGIGFLLHGNLCVGVWKEFLIVRVGPHNHESVMAEPDVKEFDITGRVMRGWAMVRPEGLTHPEDLGPWIDRAVRFVRTLPRKAP